MRETASLSPWVGKTVTCPACHRSFVIEGGDEILPGAYGKRVRLPARFDLPCGHYWPIPRAIPPLPIEEPCATERALHA